MKETNINVRSSYYTKEQLQQLSNLTGKSQADIVKELIDMAYMIVKYDSTEQNSDLSWQFIRYYTKRMG